jgi:putative phage-type endonuclease
MISSGASDHELVQFQSDAEWLEGRRASIGSSDAATVLGFGYSGSSLYALWAEKTLGYEKEHSQSLLKTFARGKLAEPYIAGLLRLDHGIDVQFDPPHSFRRSKTLPFLTASLDAWAMIDGEPVVLEFKNVSAWVGSTEFDVRAGKAPLKYTIQLQHQMAVTGWQRGLLVALCGFDTYMVPVARHQGVIDGLIAECENFWQMVQSKTPPEIDHSEATHDALKSIYPQREMVCRLTDEVSGMIDLIVELEDSIAADQKTVERYRNELLARTGGAEKLLTSDAQWWSFKSIRGGKRRLKRLKGKKG